MRFLAFMFLSVIMAAPVPAQDGPALFTAKNCHVCHAIGVDPADRLGPHLNGVLGRPVGGLDGYDYSTTLLQARDAGMVWSRGLLLRYLKRPAHAFPGTSMSYAGMVQRAEIEAMIDYLAGFSEDGAAIAP